MTHAWGYMGGPGKRWAQKSTSPAPWHLDNKLAWDAHQSVAEETYGTFFAQDDPYLVPSLALLRLQTTNKRK